MGKRRFLKIRVPDCIHLAMGVMERWEKRGCSGLWGQWKGAGSLALTWGHFHGTPMFVVAQPGAQRSRPVATSAVPALGGSLEGTSHGLSQSKCWS